MTTMVGSLAADSYRAAAEARSSYLIYKMEEHRMRLMCMGF